MNDEMITIQSRKFDGEIHRSWQMNLIAQKDSLLELRGEFEKDVTHPHLGVIRRKTVSYEFYWLDRWYNIFRFHEPDGSLRNFYCNINMPPTFSEKTLDYVDLDVDILVWRDFSYEILDLDEFAENARRYAYPNDLRLKVEAVLKELISMIEARAFPFDYKF